MKVEEIISKFSENDIRKLVRAKLKAKSKRNNPIKAQPSIGWGVDPHQGTFDRLRMSR